MSNTTQNDKQEIPRVKVRCMLCGFGAETLTAIVQHMALCHQEGDQPRLKLEGIGHGQDNH